MNLVEVRKFVESGEFRYKYECLGEGSFGSAYRLPCGSVLKRSRSIDGTALWIMDAAKVFANTGAPGKYMPKVYAFWAVRGEWFAVMEFIKSAKDRTGLCAWSCAAPEAVRDYLVGWGDKRCLERHEFSFDYPDCHGANWGYAEDGRVVVFDPFAGIQDESLHDVHQSLWKYARPVYRSKGPQQGRWA